MDCAVALLISGIIRNPVLKALLKSLEEFDGSMALSINEFDVRCQKVSCMSRICMTPQSSKLVSRDIGL